MLFPGTVRPDDPERFAADQGERHVAQRPELLDPLARDDLRDRLAQRRLAAEPQAVADAEVGDLDRMLGTGDKRRRVRGHQRTLANDGSSRLKRIVVQGDQDDARQQQRRERAPVRKQRSTFGRAVDDRAIGLEQDRERVGARDVHQDGVLLHERRVLESGQAEQRRRQVEPQPQQVAQHVAEVPEEHVDRRDRERHPQREYVLHRGDDRDEHEVDRDPVDVEQHDQAERDEPEPEADDARGRGRDRQHDLRELDLLDQPFLRDHRARRVVDARGEPFPGQDRRQDEQRVVGRAGLQDDRHEDDVDDHLEERVEQPPDVPEEGVGALLPEIGLDEIADEPSARQDLVDPLANQRKGTRPGRRVTECGRRLTGCGHRAEG